MKRYNLVLLAILISSFSFSQDILDNDEKQYNMNNVYERKQHFEKDTVSLSHLREADVMWSRKIWREIDLRQKINHPLYYPQRTQDVYTIDRENLFDVLYNAATGKGEVQIKAYKATYDKNGEFQEQMTSGELIKKVEGTATTQVAYDKFGNDSINANGEVVYIEGDKDNAIRRTDIKRWRVKEQWFFDKQRSVMDVRIIGLCPIADARDQNGNLTGGENRICWFYFKEARQVLKNAQAFNLVKNEAENKTFEDVFLKRMFSSVIVKEGNVYDRELRDYMIGLDALLEAESIKAEIFNIEHDFWEY